MAEPLARLFIANLSQVLLRSSFEVVLQSKLEIQLWQKSDGPKSLMCQKSDGPKLKWPRTKVEATQSEKLDPICK